jgi:hypothetical protein
MMEMAAAFWIAVVAVPSLGWAASDVFSRWLKFKEKMLGEAARQAATESARHIATIERLEQRVAVLERIVTDKGVETAAQIEKLRIAPLN